MEWQFTPYAALILLVAAAVLGLAAFLWRHRDVPGAFPLAVMMAAVGVWNLTAGLELSLTALSAKVLLSKAQYLGIVTVPVAWLVFSLRYTGRDGWLTRRNIALLCVLPLITLALVATNEAHGLIWPYAEVVVESGFQTLQVGHGPAFWAVWVYSYIALAVGTVVMIPALLRSPALYRMQGVAMLLAVAAPWAGNLIYVTGFSPLGGMDLMPLGFLVFGAAMTWGLSKFRLLDIVPVARYAVFDHMNDGVVVLDLRERVVDMNVAARRILSLSKTETAGLDAGVAMRDMKIVEGSERECGYREVSLGEGGDRRDYSIEPSEVLDWKGRKRGVILLMRDITEKRRAQEALRQSEERYRAVVEQTAEGIFLCDVQTRRVIESNAALQSLLGYTEDELRRMLLYDLIWHDAESVDENIRLVEKREEHCIGERRYRRKDGSLVDLEVNASLISYGGREIICIVVRDITSRKALERRLEHRASHDHLTGLPNRAQFVERLEEALRRTSAEGREVGLLFMDLDGFKEVNDTHGHDFGDRLLIEVASRLGNCLRPGDCASRFGGDEFTALLEGVSGVEEAAAVARRIESRLREPFALGGRRVQIAASTGVVTSNPAGNGSRKSAAGLIYRADLAMYGVKKSSRSGLQAFISGPRAPGENLYVAPSNEKKPAEKPGYGTLFRLEPGKLEPPDSAPDSDSPQA